MSQNPLVFDQTLSRPCPNCGYDLRAMAGSRCSECGLELDLASLAASAIPWAARRRIGRVRAYVRTVWQITADARGVRHELSRPQAIGDGRGFARITGTLLGLMFVGLLLGAWATFDDWTLNIAPPSIWPGAGPVLPGWAQDLMVPWLAGFELPGVAPGCAFLLGMALAWMPRSVFHARRLPTERGLAVEALAGYLGAPLLVAPVGLLMVGIGGALVEGSSDAASAGAALLILGFTVAVASVLLALLRAGQWVARSRHAGLLRGAAASLELTGLWAVSVVALLGIIPWCVGFFVLVIDSLR